MTNLWIESDGTANGTSVSVKGKELTGVRRVEITISESGESSVAIETDDQKVGDEVLSCCSCHGANVDGINRQINDLNDQAKRLDQNSTLSHMEAKEMLRKLLDPALVNAETSVLVIDLRTIGGRR